MASKRPMKSVRSTISFTRGLATVTCGGGGGAGPPWAEARLAAANHENRTLETNTDRGKRMRNLLIGIIDAALYFQISAYGPVRRGTRKSFVLVAMQYYALVRVWQDTQH